MAGITLFTVCFVLSLSNDKSNLMQEVDAHGVTDMRCCIWCRSAQQRSMACHAPRNQQGMCTNRATDKKRACVPTKECAAKCWWMLRKVLRNFKLGFAAAEGKCADRQGKRRKVLVELYMDPQLLFQLRNTQVISNAWGGAGDWGHSHWGHCCSLHSLPLELVRAAITKIESTL